MVRDAFVAIMHKQARLFRVLSTFADYLNSIPSFRFQVSGVGSHWARRAELDLVHLRLRLRVCISSLPVLRIHFLIDRN